MHRLIVIIYLLLFYVDFVLSVFCYNGMLTQRYGFVVENLTPQQCTANVEFCYAKPTLNRLQSDSIFGCDTSHECIVSGCIKNELCCCETDLCNKPQEPFFVIFAEFLLIFLNFLVAVEYFMYS